MAEPPLYHLPPGGRVRLGVPRALTLRPALGAPFLRRSSLPLLLYPWLEPSFLPLPGSSAPSGLFSKTCGCFESLPYLS